MNDIIAIVFFAELANTDKWIEIYLFALANEKVFQKDAVFGRENPARQRK